MNRAAPGDAAMPNARCLRVTALLVAFASLARGESETLTYVLTPQTDKGRLKVEVLWETRGRGVSALGVSRRWGTLEDVPGVIRSPVFEGQTSVRHDGTLWILEHRRGAELRVSYEVYCGKREFEWDATHHPITTREFFHGMGHAFLMAPVPENGAPPTYDVVLRWQTPADWQAACSWGAGRHTGANLRPEDLRSSVYAAGNFKSKVVKEGGLRVSFLLHPRCGLPMEDFARMAMKTLRSQIEFMGETAFPEFVITAIPVGEPLKEGDSRLSGVGLHNSFALFTAPRARLDDSVEHLFAHELFHYWNGRTLAAADPERLVFWFVEGLTDYYSLRILFESGQWNAPTYAKWLNRHLREYAFNPAINATNEQIQEQFWSARTTVGEVAYQRGLLLGLRWHRLARDNGVPDGLDRLLKSLVQRGRGGTKLTNDVIRRAGVETLGAWFGREFDTYVTGAAVVPVPENALAPALVGRLTDVYAFELGFDKERSLRQQKVRGLVKGSAAEKAGLREGDELLGWQFTGDAEQQASFTVRRGDSQQTIRFLPRGRKAQVVQFRAGEK